MNTFLPRRRMSKHELVMKFFFNHLTDTIVLSEQFWGDNVIKLKGEKALCVAILEDAIHCYLKKVQVSQVVPKKHIRLAGSRSIRLAEEAKDWFESTDTSPFTFEWICNHLNLDAGYLRKGIASLREKKIISSDHPIYRRKEVPMFFGSKRFSSETIIALVHSYGKIEEWQGFISTDFRNSDFNYWRQLFAYVLRMYAEPRISWIVIGKIIGCTNKTAENLFYRAVDSYYSMNTIFSALIGDLKKRLEKLT